MSDYQNSYQKFVFKSFINKIMWYCLFYYILGMSEEFEPLESDVHDVDRFINLLKSKKSYLMERFVKLSYDKRRETRKRMDGTYESKWKESTDKEWNRKHGVDYVDIANTEFEDLPSNRQKERMAAASVAIDLVFDKIKNWEIRVRRDV